MDAHREVMRQLGDELDLMALEQRLDEVRGDVPKLRLEGLHQLRSKIGLDDAAVLGVLRRVHSVWNRQMPGHGVAEGVVVVQNANHILVSKQGPAQKLAVDDRAALAHLVAGGKLIAQDNIGFDIPIRFRPLVIDHCHHTSHNLT